MEFDLDRVAIHPLNGLHERSKFGCRNGSIQNLCRGPLLELHDARALRAFVAVYADDPRIVGYYYLTLTSVEQEDGRALGGDVVPGDPYPVVDLGAIGVMTRVERRGVGQLLMFDALRRVATISDNAGTRALTLDATDETAAGYYEAKFEFERFKPGALRMFLPIRTILELQLTDDNSEVAVTRADPTPPPLLSEPSV